MVKTKKAATTQEQEQVTEQAFESFKQEETPVEKAPVPAVKDATEAAAAKTKKVLVSVKAEETKEPHQLETPVPEIQAVMESSVEKASPKQEKDQEEDHNHIG